MNRNHILVYDLETGGLDTDIVQILQISGKMVDPYSLKVVDTFNSWMKPDFEKEGFGDNTIGWHAGNKGISKEAMYDILREAPDTKVVWKNFVDWVNKFNKSPTNSGYTAPIPAGYNIINYDNKIMRRYCKEFGPWDKKRGDQKLFSQVWKFDVMDNMYSWFENNPELKKMGQTSVMEYMGFSEEILANAHDADVDTDMSVKLLVKFLKLQRYLTKTNEDTGRSMIQIKGCMA